MPGSSIPVCRERVNDRLLLERLFRGFVQFILEYCSAVQWSTADTHLKLLNHVVRGASVSLGVYLSVTLNIVKLWKYYACCIRSGVTRCTLFLKHFLYRTCHCGLHAVLWSHIVYLCASRCRTSQYQKTFIPRSVSQWNELGDPVFDGGGLAGFTSRTNGFFNGPWFLAPFCLLLCSLSLISFYRLVLWG